MAGVRPRAQAPQRRLLHPSARRIEQRARGGRRRRSTSPRTAASMSRSCISNARAPTTGARPRPRSKMIADAKARGARRRLRRLSLCRGLQPAEEPAAAMGAVRRRAGDARAARSCPRRATRIRADIERDGLNNWGRIPSWDCVQISISPHLPQFAGRTILALATERRPGPGRHAVRLSRRRPGRDPRAGHLDLRGRHRAHRRLADWRWSAPTAIASRPTARRQGHAASALLRHLPAHHPSLRARARRAAAGAGDPQDDRRDRARAQAFRPRAVEGKAIAPTSRSSIRRTSAIAPPTPTRTSSRPARAPPSSSMASGGGECQAHRSAAGQGAAPRRAAARWASTYVCSSAISFCRMRL